MKHVLINIFQSLLMILFGPLIIAGALLKTALIFIVSGYEGVKKEIKEGDF